MDGEGLLTQPSGLAQLWAGEWNPSLGLGWEHPSIMMGITLQGVSGAVPDGCLLGSVRTNPPFQAVYQNYPSLPIFFPSVSATETEFTSNEDECKAMSVLANINRVVYGSENPGGAEFGGVS